MDTQFQEVAEQAVSLGGVSSLGSACWGIITTDRLTWSGFLRGFILALFVAVMCYEGLRGYHIDDGLKFVITGVSAFAAEYILRAVLGLVKYATTKPVELFIKIVRG